jgi:hypothetical protein
VTLDTTDPGFSQAGDDAGLCTEYLDDLWLGAPNDPLDPGHPDFIGESRITAYHFSMDSTWNEGQCVGGDSSSSCLVRVRITSYFDHWCNERNKCGRLVLLRAWGNADPGTVAEDQLNPFTVDQEIPIHYLEVHFMGIGKNRGVALCEWGGADEFDFSGETGITWNTDFIE